MIARLLSPLIVFAVITLPAPAQGQLHQLVAADTAPSDWLGFAVAIAGDRILVGAPLDDDQGSETGSVYVFDRMTGQEVMKLVPPSAPATSVFGWSLAVSGDRVVVGMPQDNHAVFHDGSAFVFDLPTGQLISKLTASDAGMSHFLGRSVAIDGDTAVAGAPGATYPDPGAAYVFDVVSGQELHKLVPSDGNYLDKFGNAVALGGGFAAIGAPDHDAMNAYTGAVYVFDAATGQELYKLAAPNLTAFTYFGWDVAIEGSNLLVGAPGSYATGTGLAWLFEVATGTPRGVLRPSDGEEEDLFGYSVDLLGDRAIVGSRNRRHMGAEAGTAYLFDVSAERELYSLVGSDTDKLDHFGHDCVLGPDRIVIGAPQSSPAGKESGSAYAFLLPQPVGTNYCGPAVPNSTGAPGVISAEGSDLVEHGLLLLIASQLPKGQFGYFLGSLDQGWVANPGGSQGNLCLGGSIGRFSKLAQKSDASGEFSILVDLGAIPTTPPSVVMAGETWSFQAWFRDANPDSTSNFTDGVAVAYQ